MRAKKTKGRASCGVFASDLRHIGQSTVAIALLVVLLIVPCAFAWANIMSSWDPYIEESTAKLPIALANEDIGFDVMGMNLSVGSIVMGKLEETDILGWLPMGSREEAVSAVNSGKCYAAVIIPTDFTSGFLTLFEGEEALRHPTLEFYQNSKKNAVVTSLLLKAKDTIANNVNSSLASTIGDGVDMVCKIAAGAGIDPDQLGEVLAEKLDGLTNTLDQVLLAVKSLQQLANDGTDLLGGAAGTIYTLGDILASATTTLGNANTALGTSGLLINQSLTGISQLLRDVNSLLDDALGQGKQGANPFQASAETLTKYLAALENMRGSYLGTDPIALAALDSARTYLNQALTVASNAVLPDDGDYQQTAIQNYISQALAAVNAKMDEARGYFTELGTYTNSIRALKNDISNAIFSGSVSDYVSRAEQIRSTLLSKASSSPYSSYPTASTYLTSAAGSMQTAINLLNASTNIISFNLNKSQIETALTQATYYVTAARTVFPSSSDVSDVSDYLGILGVIKDITEFAGISIPDSASTSDIERNLNDIAQQVQYAQAIVNNNFNASSAVQPKLMKLADDLEALAQEVNIPEFRSALMNVAADIRTMLSLSDALELPEQLEAFLAAGSSARKHLEVATAILAGPLVADATNLIAQIRTMLYGLSETLLGVTGESYKLSKALGEYANAMGQANLTVDMTVELIEKLNTNVSKLASDFSKITTTEGYRKLMEVIRKNPDAIADYIGTPITLDKVELFPVENYGSSMTAYYMMFALYLGTLLPPVFLKVRRFRNDGTQYLNIFGKFFGRYMIFLILNIAQGLLAGLGCLYFIGIQCVNPAAFLLSCVLSAVCFGMINYGLTFAMDLMGLGLSGAAMIVQIAGADGTYPVEVIDKLYQMAYKYMPFRYGMNMVRESVCGRYGSTYIDSALVLLAITVGFAIIGLVLYYPSKFISDKVSESMEKTGLM